LGWVKCELCNKEWTDLNDPSYDVFLREEVPFAGRDDCVRVLAALISLVAIY